MGPFWVVIIVVLFLGLFIGIGSMVFWHLRAKRLGLPPPSWQAYVPFATVPNPGSGGDAIPDKPPTGLYRWIVYAIQHSKNKNRRTATGAYEGAAPLRTGRQPGRQGFDPLGPDDAWDTRVGAEADAYYYNEEQELGLHPGGAQHGNASQLSVAGGGGGGGGGGGAGGSTAYLGSAGVAAAGSTYDMNVPAPAPAPAYGEADRGRTLGGRAANPFDDQEADPSNLSLRGVSPRPMA